MYHNKTIAIDYDDTYTLHPEMWEGIISIMLSYGFTVYIITYRHSTQFSDMNMEIPGVTDYIFTSGKAKRKYCLDNGLHIAIWIDDSPECIHLDWKDLPIL